MPERDTITSIYTKTIYYMTLLLAFVTPLSWQGSRALIVLIIIIWIAGLDYKGFFERIKNSLVLIFLLLFVLYEISAIFWTQTSLMGEETYFTNYFLWFAIPILVTTLKREQAGSVIMAFLAGMLVSEIAAYGMFFELWTINGHSKEYPSPFIYHAHYSLLMAFAALLLLNRIFSRGYSLTEKLLMGMFFVAISGNLFILQENIGQLAFIVGIIVAGIVHIRLRPMALFTSVFFVVSVLLITYYTTPMFAKRVDTAIADIKKMEQGNLNSPWGIRMVHLKAGWETVKNASLFRTGEVKQVVTENIGMTVKKSNLSNQKHTIEHHIHNQYLMIAIQSGLVGLGLFLTVLLGLLWLPVRDVELRQVAVVFYTIIAVSLFADTFLSTGPVLPLFILFTSLFTLAAI